MKEYISYLGNLGVVHILDFDDDFQPAGPMARDRLLKDGMIKKLPNHQICLTEKGRHLFTGKESWK